MRFSPYQYRDFRKRPSPFRRFPTIFRTLPNVPKNVRRCWDDVWALPKLFGRRQFSPVLILLGRKVITRRLFGIFSWKLNWIFVINHVLKKRFVRICESGMRNCPWCVRSMSLFRSREILASCVRVGRYINYISSFVFDLLSLHCNWFDSGISIACDRGIKDEWRIFVVLYPAIKSYLPMDDMLRIRRQAKTKCEAAAIVNVWCSLYDRIDVTDCEEIRI